VSGLWRCSKHFGIAHYTLWVLSCTLWACNANPKCAPQDPYCVMGSTKMYLGISHLLRKRWIRSRADNEKIKAGNTKSTF